MDSVMQSATEKQRTLVDETAENLISFILTRNMQEGDKLPNETRLSDMLNVGRGTLREAVKQLVSRNILYARQGSGTYVSDKRGIPQDPLGAMFLENNTRNAINLIEARLALEPNIAAEAALCVTPEQCERLQELCILHSAAIRQGTDYQKVDTDFHEYIAVCTGNPIFSNLVSIIASASIQISTSINDNEYRQISARYHRIITDAICNKDPLGARNGMLAHINVSREYLRRRLKEEGKS